MTFEVLSKLRKWQKSINSINHKEKLIKLNEKAIETSNKLENFIIECFISEEIINESVNITDFIHHLNILDRIYYMEDAINKSKQFITKTGSSSQLKKILIKIIEKERRPSTIKLSDLRDLK